MGGALLNLTCRMPAVAPASMKQPHCLVYVQGLALALQDAPVCMCVCCIRLTSVPCKGAGFDVPYRKAELG